MICLHFLKVNISTKHKKPPNIIVIVVSLLFYKKTSGKYSQSSIATLLKDPFILITSGEL